MRVALRHRVGRVVAILGVALLALIPVTTIGSPGAGAGDVGIRQIGALEAIVTGATVGGVFHDNWPPPMSVDSQRHLGFSVGYRPADLKDPAHHPVVAVYDLKGQRPVGTYDPLSSIPGVTIRTASVVTVDPRHQRLFAQVTNATTTAPACGLLEPASVLVADYSHLQVDGTLSWEQRPLPCLGLEYFDSVGGSVSYDRSSDKLYMAGTFATHDSSSGGRFLLGAAGANYNDGQPMVVVQMDATTFAVDWAVDLTNYGCGRWHHSTTGDVSFVQRVGDAVLSYCNDASPGPVDAIVGRQGYVVRIPLHNHQLAPTSGSIVLNPESNTAVNAVVERMPAIADGIQDNPVVPIADPGTNYLLLLSSDAFSGNAVWVHDPVARRFVGVVTGGQQAPPRYDIAVGMDDERGIAYLLNAGGVVSVPIRQMPLPTGQNWRVLENTDRRSPFVTSPYIGVDSELRRLFVPLTDGSGYAVLQDDTVVPPAPAVVDPDSLTSQLTEAPGKTEAHLSGTGIAFGARTLVTGGLPRVVNQNDPFCYAPFPGTAFDTAIERANMNGKCVADQVVASGNSDVYLASTATATDSSNGAAADAAGFAVGSEDTSTKADMQGNDIPPAAVTCNDGGGQPETATSPPSGGGLLVGASTVSCTGAKPSSTASSAFGGLAWPDAGGPQIAVGHVSSAITSGPSADGQTTKVTAVARGVVIGPVTIGQVWSEATTVARGRTGTARTTYTRRWCAVTVADDTTVPGCIDPADPDNADLIDTINLQLGRVWISAPAPNGPQDTPPPATDGGYQAVVTKSVGNQASDRAVNDDYSTVVPGLQAITYNDGPAGRSRVILQLAGVHAESRYAITAIPDLADGGSGGSSGTPGTSGDADQLVPGSSTFTPGSGATLGVENASSEKSIPEAIKDFVKRILRIPAKILKEAVRLILQNPREFALLLAVWTLLAAPPYLAHRRRARARALVA